MTLKEAIKRADALRNNVMPEAEKAEWIYKLDCEIAGYIGADMPEWLWPEDSELLMPAPHDDVYVLYLVAMIDYYLQDTTIYANDMEIYNAAMADARAWHRRNNRPARNSNWKVM